MSKILSFLKKDTVLVISLVLAVVSCFFTAPDKGYFSYIDFNTLGLLFCLMAAVAGLSAAGVFEFLAKLLLRRTRTLKSLRLVLTMLCFFSSMFITNDVALITFVPFAITVLNLAERSNDIPYTVVLQTVAANMGSCLTPLGNPQNLYIYSISGISFAELFITMLPYGAVCLVMLIFACLLFKNGSVEISSAEETSVNKGKTALFAALFVISLLSVLKIVPLIISLGAVLAILIIFDRKTLARVDYSLLFTFVGFFIFVGNMGRVEIFSNLLSEVLSSSVSLTGIISSQIISNVPAAILLSNFTESYKELLIGVNVGGLGTLIASMASLISYKFVLREMPDKKGTYLMLFSFINIIFLVPLIIICCIS